MIIILLFKKKNTVQCSTVCGSKRVRNCNSPILATRWRHKSRRPNPFIFLTDGHKLFFFFFEGLYFISKCWNLKRLSPVFCCCPSQLQWCSHLCPRPLQWERWTGHCLRRGSQIWTRTLRLHCKPRAGHNTGLEEPNTAPTSWNLSELLYLHGVIVKIGHDNFILVVHRNKVRTWMRKEMRFIVK